jgi:Na+-driven multidrug efflux pump
LLILPPIFGLKGIWYAFPIADVITAIIVFWYLRIGMKKLVSAPIVSYPTEYIEDVYAATDK